MFARLCRLFKEKIRLGLYVMTLHAEEEMEADGLTIYDVERAILSGSIVERQKDKETGEWKYRVAGQTIARHPMETVVKLGKTGKLVIVTVYIV
jgi:hypothetical protein